MVVRAWPFVRRHSPAFVSAAALLVLAGCNHHRLIGGASGDEGAGDDAPEPWADDDGGVFLPVDDLPPPELPPGCDNGVLEVGDVCPVPESPVAAGIDPCDISVGDFNRDGRPDVAVPNSDFTREDEPDHVANVLFGTGDGLGAPVVYAAGGPLPVSIVTLDHDGDGFDDLAVGNSSTGSVTRLENTGSGSTGLDVFETLGFTLPSDVVGTIAAGDIDGDGVDEIVLPVPAVQASLAVIDGFDVTVSPVPENVVELAVGDIDDDGIDDVVVATGAGNLQVLRNEGDQWTVVSSVYAESYNFGQVALADLDGDGHLDALTTGIDGQDLGGVLRTFAGDGSGGFSSWTFERRANDFGLHGLAVADFDADGLPDVVLTERERDRVYFYRATAPAEFEMIAEYATGETPVSVSVADFNGDDVPDAAVALQHANQVQLFISRY